MNDLLLADIQTKKVGFRDFLLKRNPSGSFANKYVTYLNSKVVKNKTKLISGKEEIYSVESLSLLNEIYFEVKTDSDNIRLHNIYSGVVSAYIKFLTGNELRKMVVSKE